MYSRTPFCFLLAHLRKYMPSFLLYQYFFPGTIPFLSVGTASGRPVLCQIAAVFNLAARTERAIISTLVFRAVQISEPEDHGKVSCCTQCDRRAVQMCRLPQLLTFSVFCGQGISPQMALTFAAATSWRRGQLFTDRIKYFILKLSIPRIFRLMCSVYLTN